MTIEVCHIRHRKGLEGQYIGRPSPFGNPFIIGRDGSRARVISKYREWLAAHLTNPPTLHGPLRAAFQELWQRHEAGEHIRLFCYCAPDPCHGDVIKELAEQVRLHPPLTADACRCVDRCRAWHESGLPFEEQRAQCIFHIARAGFAIIKHCTACASGTWHVAEQCLPCARRKAQAGATGSTGQNAAPARLPSRCPICFRGPCKLPGTCEVPL